MDLVLVGLPGSGKSAVGRRLAARHEAAFVDLDVEIETAAGMTIPEIFEAEGEAGFRRRERRAVAALGPPDPGPGLRRVISPGGGAILDPCNRWTLFRGRVTAWLDVRPEVLAQRLRRSSNVRPLVHGGDPLMRIRTLAADRERFYGAAQRINGVAEVGGVIRAFSFRMKILSPVHSATYPSRLSMTASGAFTREASALASTLFR